MTGSVLSVNASTAVPAATSSSLGTIQLAGALTGSATAPTLATGSVGATQIVAGSVGATQLGANVVGNGQLAPLSAPSELIGSNSASPNATNISLGSGFSVANKPNYLRYQTVSAAWAPSFAFTGLNASTDVLMGSGWWPQNIGNSTSVTMYSFCGSQASTVINTFDSNVPSVLAGGSNTGPTFNATNNFTTCTLDNRI